MWIGSLYNWHARFCPPLQPSESSPRARWPISRKARPLTRTPWRKRKPTRASNWQLYNVILLVFVVAFRFFRFCFLVNFFTWSRGAHKRGIWRLSASFLVRYNKKEGIFFFSFFFFKEQRTNNQPRNRKKKKSWKEKGHKMRKITRLAIKKVGWPFLKLYILAWLCTFLKSRVIFLRF